MPLLPRSRPEPAPVPRTCEQILTALTQDHAALTALPANDPRSPLMRARMCARIDSHLDEYNDARNAPIR